MKRLRRIIVNRPKPIKTRILINFNKALQIYYSIFGSKVECNICRYKTSILDSDRWHKYIVCPMCHSVVRQRLLWATLNSKGKYNIDNIIKHKAVLHFAPEKEIGELIETVAGKYKRADFLAEGYANAYRQLDYNMDISDMNQLKDGEYDCVIACDVLEHVYNDKKALQEIYRVLAHGGYCILTVPQKDGLEKSYEDLSITNPNDREKQFGQSDHLRIYGNDFAQLMKNIGFETDQIDENNFNKKKRIKNVLFPPLLSNHPLATNYRKIFIGYKS